mgnify:CR=1 FL=1
MTVKEADIAYILAEEKKFLGTEIGNFFEEPERQVAGYESIKVELTSPTGTEAYVDWVNSAFYNSLSTWDKSPEKFVSEMHENYNIEQKENLLFNIIKERPISVALEGTTFCFKVTGIPRTQTHQIVRARQAAFGQTSLRVASCYSEPIRVPQSLLEKENNTELLDVFVKTVKMCRETYKRLIESGIPMEQARNIMPMGTCTNIGMCMNLRTLIDYVKGRTGDIAQDEHTYIVCLMMDELRKKQPKFFNVVKMFVPNVETTMEKYGVKS